MIRLCVSLERVTELLNDVNHQTFEKARSGHWRAVAGNDGRAYCTGRSFCWLYCWAYNGMNAPDAMHRSRDVLNNILGCYVQGGSFYNTFHSDANHDWALNRRGRPHSDIGVERELAQRAPYVQFGNPEGPPPPPTDKCETSLRKCQAELEATKAALAQLQADFAQRQAELERTRLALAQSQAALAQRQPLPEVPGTELENCRRNHRRALDSFAVALKAAYQDLTNRLG